MNGSAATAVCPDTVSGFAAADESLNAVAVDVGTPSPKPLLDRGSVRDATQPPQRLLLHREHGSNEGDTRPTQHCPKESTGQE